MDKNQNKSQELQAKIQEYQVYQEQFQGLQEYKENIYTTIEDLEVSINAIEELKNSETGKELIFPIGASTFAIGELKENSKVIVDLGAGVFSKKSTKEAVKFIESKKEEKKNIIEQINQRLNNLQKKMEEVARRIRSRPG